MENNQNAKSDAGKIRPTMVPPEVIWAIAVIREYGTQKYGDQENWRQVEPQRYRDAAYRHFLHYLADPRSVDPESGYMSHPKVTCGPYTLTDYTGDSVTLELNSRFLGDGSRCKFCCGTVRKFIFPGIPDKFLVAGRGDQFCNGCI